MQAWFEEALEPFPHCRQQQLVAYEAPIQKYELAFGSWFGLTGMRDKAGKFHAIRASGYRGGKREARDMAEREADDLLGDVAGLGAFGFEEFQSCRDIPEQVVNADACPRRHCLGLRSGLFTAR